jgi:site-specific DNA-cytosine methylase
MAKKNTKEKQNGVKWGSIIPLIGGMAVANKNATGNDPSFILSYPAFEGNDSHCVNHFNETPYVVIDPETNELPEVTNALFDDVDFVSTVCPCAGLSMLNSSKDQSGKSRGGDAAQNDWMYKSAELVLEQVRPKVFWGENAPGLYSNMGIKVVERLREIGKKHGYSFSLVKTDTFVHGIPQHRMRSFYFFWKDSEAPILGYHKKEAPMLEEYLNQVPEDASGMDRPFGIGDISENAWFLYAKSKGWTTRKLIESQYKTMFHFVAGEELIDDCLEWAEQNGQEGIVKFISHIKKKLADNKGWWDGTPLIFHDATNAIIAKNACIVHPGKERGITIREAMHLMGLPHDFEMVNNAMNHICQNVPVTTATDWTSEIVRFIKGEIQEFGGDFVKQNNIAQRIDYAEKTVKSKILF